MQRFMTKRLAFLFFLLFSAFSSFAQSPERGGLATIPDSLFNEARLSAAPDVPFTYALKSLDVTFEEEEQSIVAVLQYHVRVKVFDASVKEASIVGIPYYFENDIERVSDISAVTWQSPNKRVPLSNDQIRTINVNSRYNVKEFTMPAVQNGSIIEYKYTIRRRYLEELPDFYLAHQVPTSLAKVTITYPTYLRYKALPENFSRPLDHTVTRIDSSDVPKIFTYPQPAPKIRETWIARNIPAVRKESYISSLDDYRSKLKFQLSEFGIPRQKLENSWDYIVAEIRRKQQLSSKIAANITAADLGGQIRQATETQEAAQDSIFRYLNDRMNFSGDKSPFSQVGDKVVLAGKPADQAAINQTLAAMLNGAGMEAYPVLISTRESGQINKSFPSFFEFNGQLVYTEIDGQSYFMDASFPHSQPNLIPVDSYNENGLVLKPQSYDWVAVEPDKSMFSIQVDMEATLQRNGTLTGSVISLNEGYPAQLMRQQYADGQSITQVILQAVFDGYTNAELSEASLQNLQTHDQPAKIETSFTLPDYAVSYSSGLEFRPMVVGYLMRNPFSDAQRELPVTLDAPEKLDLRYHINLPEGYSVKQLPQDRTIALPGATFAEHYSVNGQTLEYAFQIDISRKKFAPDLYPRLLNLYNRWVNLSNSTWLIQR